MKIIFFDTETTGNTDQDRLCQLGIKDRGMDAPLVNALYTPPVPISVESMAVHHITPKMVEGRPAFRVSSDYLEVKALFEHPEVISVAHNVVFDLGMLAREGIVPHAPICTYKVARALDPNELIGKYGLQYLRYFFDLDVQAIAHDAWGDVLVLEQIFEHLLSKMIKQYGTERAAISEMIAITARPLLFTSIRFGKHKGKTIEEVVRIDRGYLEWLLGEKKKTPAGEEDWIFTLEHYLAR